MLEMSKIDECDMNKFGTRDSTEKLTAILGDGGHRRRNRKGIDEQKVSM